MATSYKTRWQEANKEIERLTAKVQDLRRMNDELSALITSGRSLRGDTRQIVDLAGIARHMHVERFTPQQWKQRGLLPPVDFPEIREPLWYASTVLDQFVTPTGREWFTNSAAEDRLSPAA